MVVCAAGKCSNSSRIKNMRFFKFPSDEARRKQWTTNSGLANDPGPYGKLCEIHFEENQFELHRQDGWKKLKPNAVPSIFPEPPESPKKSREKAVRKRKVVEPPEEIKTTKRPAKRKRSQSTHQSSPVKKKKTKSLPSDSSQLSQKENVSPKTIHVLIGKRKGRPHKVSSPEPDSSSETEIEASEEEEEEENEQQKEIAVLKKENESMRQEIQEFERHNKAMSRVILELEKHNKAMSLKLQELDKDNKVMSKKLQDLEKLNEDLKSKLNCCFSEEQFARMEKLMALGKIERYIPGIK